MMQSFDIKSKRRAKNIGFISTRLAGTDGVSLETAKWADVFEGERFSCFYFTGELDRPKASYSWPKRPILPILKLSTNQTLTLSFQCKLTVSLTVYTIQLTPSPDERCQHPIKDRIFI
jgi:hypothetical protein